jgi:hypothetical protein
MQQHDPARPGREPYIRDEPVAHRLDRNYGELLQELRVAQTGIQILFAFLLTIPFQPLFRSLSDFQTGVYLATLLSSAVAVVLLVAPVATHRLLFRLGLKDEVVRVAARLAAGGLTFLGIAILGAVVLVVDLVAGPVAALIVGAALAALIVTFWLVFPGYLRRTLGTAPDPTRGAHPATPSGTPPADPPPAGTPPTPTTLR